MKAISAVIFRSVISRMIINSGKYHEDTLIGELLEEMIYGCYVEGSGREYG